MTAAGAIACHMYLADCPCCPLPLHRCVITPDAKASSQALIKGAFMSISPVTISPVGGKSKAAPAAGEEGQEPSAKRQRTESGAEAAANGAATNGGSGDVAMADGEGAAAAAGAGGAAGATAGSEVHWPGTGEEAEAQVEAVAYVCELAGVPGKFDPKKAIALGLKPGPVSGPCERSRFTGACV